MRNSLLRNNGDGTFTDVTKEAGLSSGEHATHSVSWADIDNDGWLDVFVGHELTPSQLFRNRGDGTFEDITAKAGVGASTFAKGTNFGDYDNDGYPDLYISNMFGDNLLYHNNRDGTFTEVGKHAPRREAVRELPDVVLRLRQRRLARHLRVVVRDIGRGVPEVLPAPADSGRGRWRSITTTTTGRSPTSRRTSASTASSRRWAPTSATSTTTATSTSISAPARRRSRR